MHGSYNTYKNQEQISKEKKQLKQTMDNLGISQEIIGCRQHYLRWSPSQTASLLSNSGFAYDTTLSYADRPGFRCGTCHEFQMFDIINGKQLEIVQRPLINMECSVISDRYLGLGYKEEALNTFLRFKKICKQFEGNYTLLWHNSHLTTKMDRIFYKELIH
jgi:hypothetical protein